MKIVTCAIFRQKDKILIARRKKGEKHEGFWEFPGGKLNQNETPEECLKRELEEEFSISADIGEFFVDSLYEYDYGRILLKAYFIDDYSGDFKLSVHDKIVWEKPENVKKFQLLPADIPILNLLIDF
ncbi:MAG: (deoxy)nucleoside triphosphate pyrophosphohydrolase [Candidatus Muiribacteriota bacterium]